MRGDELARAWRILRAIKSRKQGGTVAELAAQEGWLPPSHYLARSGPRSRQFPLVTNERKCYVISATRAAKRAKFQFVRLAISNRL